MIQTYNFWNRWEHVTDIIGSLHMYLHQKQIRVLIHWQMLTNGFHYLNKSIFHPKFIILHIFVSIWYIEKLLLVKGAAGYPH